MAMLGRAEQWSTDQVSLDARTDTWRHVVAANYRQWELPRGLARDFAAWLRYRELGGLRLVECLCGPCSGHRLARELSRDPEPFLAIQVVRDGAERLRVGEETVQAAAGDLLIWSSLKATEFEIPERLHKATIMIPLAAAADWLPAGKAFDGCVLPARSGIAAVLTAHVDALVAQIDSFDEADGLAARRATIELLGAAVARRMGCTPMPLAQLHLRRAQDYIMKHLRDPALTLKQIARANGMSVRYLHLLFAQATRQGVSSWIREQRLQRCRDALADGVLDGPLITEIAFSWGFNDAAHFSRRFKRRFGQSPSAFRAAAGRTGDAG
ncbi:helix-turn-helix domain-containing protein [Vineibacter terrae]|nr:helix-turn-helix domain-containing protein [Vineibacter terrae]